MKENVTDKQITEAVKELAHADHLKWHSLRLYLNKEKSEGKREFRLVVGENNKCYMHPLSKDGTTLDFDLLDTNVKQEQPSVKSESAEEYKTQVVIPIQIKHKNYCDLNGKIIPTEFILDKEHFFYGGDGYIVLHDFANSQPKVSTKGAEEVWDKYKKEAMDFIGSCEVIIKDDFLQAMHDFANNSEQTESDIINSDLTFKFKDEHNTAKVNVSMKFILDKVEEYVYEKLEEEHSNCSCTNESQSFCECEPMFENFELYSVCVEANNSEMKENAIGFLEWVFSNGFYRNAAKTNLLWVTEDNTYYSGCAYTGDELLTEYLTNKEK